MSLIFFFRVETKGGDDDTLRRPVAADDGTLIAEGRAIRRRQRSSSGRLSDAHDKERRRSRDADAIIRRQQYRHSMQQHAPSVSLVDWVFTVCGSWLADHSKHVLFLQGTQPQGTNGITNSPSSSSADGSPKPSNDNVIKKSSAPATSVIPKTSQAMHHNESAPADVGNVVNASSAVGPQHSRSSGVLPDLLRQTRTPPQERSANLAVEEVSRWNEFWSWERSEF